MRNEIRQRILSLLGPEVKALGDDEPLVTSGRFNSLKVIELATWLEEKYHIDFYAHTFHVKDFNSVNDVLKLVENKVREGNK